MSLVRNAHLVALVAMVFVASGPVAAQDVERLRIHGSATIGARVMPMVVQDWLRDSGYTAIRKRTFSTGRSEITASAMAKASRSTSWVMDRLRVSKI